MLEDDSVSVEARLQLLAQYDPGACLGPKRPRLMPARAVGGQARSFRWRAAGECDTVQDPTVHSFCRVPRSPRHVATPYLDSKADNQPDFPSRGQLDSVKLRSGVGQGPGERDGNGGDGGDGGGGEEEALCPRGRQDCFVCERGLWELCQAAARRAAAAGPDRRIRVAGGGPMGRRLGQRPRVCLGMPSVATVRRATQRYARVVKKKVMRGQDIQGWRREGVSSGEISGCVRDVDSRIEE